MRPGLGSAGRIIQRADRSALRITIEQPMLILVEEGTKRIRWAGGERSGGPGDALALQPGEVVDMTNTPGPSGQYRALWIGWGPGALPARPQPDPALSDAVALHPGIEDEFRAAFERAFDALSDAVDLPAAITRSRLQEVLLWLAERGFRFRSAPAPSVLEQVREVLCADPAADWSMEGVAQRAACSVATLRRRLVAEGVGFRDLLHDVRMAHALTILQNTDESVLNVALAVGYRSASRFAARFHARFGYLPSDIRGQHRGRPGLYPAVAAE